MTTSLPFRIYAELKAEIISHSLPPATSLKIESLAKKFDTSIIPVREALARLCNEDLVTQERRLGYRVRSISMASLEDDYTTLALLFRIAVGYFPAPPAAGSASSQTVPFEFLENFPKNSESISRLNKLLLDLLPTSQLRKLCEACLLKTTRFDEIDLYLRGETAERIFYNRRQRLAVSLARGRTSQAAKLLAEECSWRVENASAIIKEILYRKASEGDGL